MHMSTAKQDTIVIPGTIFPPQDIVIRGRVVEGRQFAGRLAWMSSTPDEQGNTLGRLTDEYTNKNIEVVIDEERHAEILALPGLPFVRGDLRSNGGHVVTQVTQI
jgi:hypothetical protein